MQRVGIVLNRSQFMKSLVSANQIEMGASPSQQWRLEQVSDSLFGLFQDFLCFCQMETTLNPCCVTEYWAVRVLCCTAPWVSFKARHARLGECHHLLVLAGISLLCHRLRRGAPHLLHLPIGFRFEFLAEWTISECLGDTEILLDAATNKYHKNY